MANKKALQLNDFAIKAIKKPQAKKWIRDGNGLALCLMPSKTGAWRHWYFIYTSPETGKKCYKHLGSYPDVGLSAARDEVDSLRALVKKKIDPKEEERREMEAKMQADEKRRRALEAEEKNITVAKLIEEYIGRHAKRFKRSWEKDQAILNRDVVPLWEKRKAADITKRDIVQLLEGIVDRGAPAMANNCFQIVRKMFNWAVEKDILPHTPCTGVKLPSPKLSRERTLSEAEIKTMWGSLDKCAMSDEIRRALKLILLTAQRPGEVIGIHSSEIDGRWWTIPGERAKNGKTHRVFLTNTALELIGPLEMPDKETGEMKPKGYIFRTPHTKKEQAMAPQALIVAVARGLAFPLLDNKGNQLFTENGKPATENRLGIDHFSPHDLRRTAATFMAEMGTMDEVIDAILNHAKQGVIKVYNQYRYDREKQSTLEAWERKLTSLTSGTTGKVIPMRKGQSA